MHYPKGFICITNREWNHFLSKNKFEKTCIWSRKTSFKAINYGEPIFFVERKSRLIRGYGLFNAFEVNTTKKCWGKYGETIGAKNFEDFLNQLNFPNIDRAWNKEIGNILITNVKWIKEPLHINNVDVEFHSATVTGKTISSEEVTALLTLFHN